MVLVPIETKNIFLNILHQSYDGTLFLGPLSRVLTCLNISISVSFLTRTLTPTRG